MREFTTVALSEAEKKKAAKSREEDAAVIKLDGEELKFFYPGFGQYSVMGATFRGEMDGDRISTMISLIFSMTDTETGRHLEDRLMDFEDPFTVEGEGGLMDIWVALMEEWSGKVSAKQSGSAKQRSRSGTRSTVTSRAKASTSSPSPSRARSRSSSTG